MTDNAIFFAGCVLVFVLVIAGMFAVGARQCIVYGEVTGRQTEWRIIGGCFAQADDGRWYPSDKIWDEGASR